MSEEMTVPDLREAFDRLTKDKKGLLQEVEDLTKRVRVGEAKDAFREAGYTPANGALFAAINPDGEITADAVTAFATEQGLTPLVTGSEAKEQEGDTTSDDKDGSKALAALAGSGSRAGDGGAGGATADTLTRQEWQQLYADDPAAGKAAITSGRVEISRDNVYAKNTSLPKGVNPYALARETD